MTNYKICFRPDNITMEASPGESIVEVASRAGLHINASCGGAGVCGRCRVELVEGQVESDSGPGAFLSADEYQQGQRLACLSYVSGDAVILIPPASRADASVYATSLSEVEVSGTTLEPMVREIEVALEGPSIMDNSADYCRLLAYLSANCGLETPEIELGALLELPSALREGDDFKAQMLLFEEAGKSLITGFHADPLRPLYALAIDIGTTTVWARLINIKTGENGPSHGDLNGQISFGEDVISRIIYASKGDGAERLKERVVDNINKLLDILEAEVPGSREQISLVVASGNTTMSHLLTGVSSKSIRLAPYVPVADFWPVLRASELGLKVKNTTPFLLYPSVSSYVGGDIVSGVLASEMYKSQALTLFIDVGTNGEIVVGNEDWMTCAACSAGPAFEGGGVKFGMRAAPGAIDQFYFNPETRKHRLTVIGQEAGEKPLGICGSGIINIVAELFTYGILDPQGKFVMENAPELIRAGDDGLEYILCPAAETALKCDLVLTEIDVENLIRAKGAMYSGYQTLLENVGLTIGDLERVIIGGGFGKSLNLHNAITIGFLPELPPEKFTYIGNSSLTGATLAALSGEMWQKAKDIKASMTNFELSETPGYMDYYMSSQFLPHTQSSLFPETNAMVAKKKLKAV